MAETIQRASADTARLLIEVAPGRWGRKFHIAQGEVKLSLGEIDAVRIAKDILRNSKPKGAFLWGDTRAKRKT